MKTCVLVSLIPCAILAACSRKEAPPASIPSTSSGPATAQAILASKSGSSVTGALQVTATADGVTFTGQVKGLNPTTQHGFHIHQIGDCSERDAMNAGNHFDPFGAQHGNPVAGAHHMGDMGNIMSDDTGTAIIDVTVTGATLGDRGPHDLFGRAVIVHANRDDYRSQPAGDSGARIACGVIRADKRERDS